MKFANAILKFLLVLIVLAFCLVCLGGCGTVAPKSIPAKTISYSGNVADGGIVSLVYSKPDHKFLGFEVTPDWVARHDRRMAQYGDQIRPAVDDSKKGITTFQNGNFLVTKQVMDSDLQAADLERDPLNHPPTPGWQKLINRIFP